MERLKSNLKEIVEDFNADDVEMLDTTAVVLKFKEDVPAETINWICNLIQKPVTSGGASLLFKEYVTDPEESTAKFYIVTATLEQLFLAAERHQLLKQMHDGFLIPFTYKHCHDFENYEEDNQDFFSSSEKQFLLKQMLDHVVCDMDDLQSVPNFPKVKIYKNRPILPGCIAHKVLQLYPLHHFDTLKPLKRKWYMSYNSVHQPIDEIKSYFGEVIALYFSFLSFYTKFLVPPAVIGILHWLVFVDENKADNVWFAVLNVIWSTVFLEIWKRKGSSIVFGWGRLTNTEETNILLEEPRAEYKGHPRVSPITGLLEPHYPTWRRRMKMYFVSYPILIISLCFAMGGMWLYFEFKETLDASYKNTTGLWSGIVKRLPGICYSILIYCVNNGYGRIAVRLNQWENHRVQSSYNGHLIIKLVCFYFINSFLPLFYIAFYLQDMALLRQQLATQLITQQFIQQIQESVFPYFHYKKHSIEVKKEGKQIKLKKIRDPKNQVVREGNMPSYSDTFGDYLEMFTQFGYVFMFSASYPLAAFWAIINNVIELRTDAFKLCKLHQRPFAETTKSIGVWQTAFEFMGVIAVMTNVGLIALSKTTKAYFNMEDDPANYILRLVILEHVLIAVKLFIAKMIPDVPGNITKSLAKTQYKTQQEIKDKRLLHIQSHRLASENVEQNHDEL